MMLRFALAAMIAVCSGGTALAHCDDAAGKRQDAAFEQIVGIVDESNARIETQTSATAAAQLEPLQREVEACVATEPDATRRFDLEMKLTGIDAERGVLLAISGRPAEGRALAERALSSARRLTKANPDGAGDVVWAVEIELAMIHKIAAGESWR